MSLDLPEAFQPRVGLSSVAAAVDPTATRLPDDSRLHPIHAAMEATLAGLHTPAAEARRVAAGAPFSLLEGLELDGMGQGLVVTHLRSPPDPGTWTLGAGIAAAPGAGAGLAVRFVHPDLGGRRHRLDLAIAADTRFGDQFDRHPRLRIDRAQVEDQLRQILDRIDVVVRRRADQPHPRG